MEGRTRQTLRSSGHRCRSPCSPHIRKLQEKLGRAERLLTQLVRRKSPVAALALFFASADARSAAMPARCTQTASSRKCRPPKSGTTQVAITKEACLRAEASIKNGGFGIRDPCSTLRQPSWPQAAALPTWPLLRHSSAATSKRTAGPITHGFNALRSAQ